MKSGLAIYVDDLKRHWPAILVGPLVGWAVFRIMRPDHPEPGLITIAPIAVVVATAASFRAFLDLRGPRLEFLGTRPVGLASTWLVKLAAALTLAGSAVAVCALLLWGLQGHVVAGTPVSWTVRAIVTAFLVTLAAVEALALAPLWVSITLLIVAMIALTLGTAAWGWSFADATFGIGFYQWGVDVIVWVLAGVLLLAGATALARARGEHGRQARLRLFLVVAILVCAGVAGGAWTSWLQRAEVSQLAAVDRTRYGAGRWLWVHGAMADWPPRSGSFVVDLDSGHSRRTAPWGVHISDDETTLLEHRMRWTWRGPRTHLAVWDLTGAQPRLLLESPAPRLSLGWTALVGRDSIVAAGSERVERYDLSTGRRTPLWFVPLDFRISRAQLLRGSRIRIQVSSLHAISSEPDSRLSDLRVVELDASTGEFEEKFRLERRGWGWMRWSRDGRRLLMSRPTGADRVVTEVELRDAETGALIAVFAGGSSSRFLHDGRVAAIEADALVVYDANGAGQVRVPLPGGVPLHVGFEPAPKQVWVERFDVRSPSTSALLRADLTERRVVQTVEGLVRPPDVDLADSVHPGSPASRLARETGTGRLVRVNDAGSYERVFGGR